MSKPFSVEIIGKQVARSDGFKDTWGEVAEWAAGQLQARFGDAVQADYYDFFDPGCPAIPVDSQLPVVLVDGQLLSSGRKISVPAIRKRLEVLAGQITE